MSLHLEYIPTYRFNLVVFIHCSKTKKRNWMFVFTLVTVRYVRTHACTHVRTHADSWLRGQSSWFTQIHTHTQMTWANQRATWMPLAHFFHLSQRGDACDSQQLAAMKVFLITLLCASVCLSQAQQDSNSSVSESPTTASPSTESTISSTAPTSINTTSPAATVYTPATGKHWPWKCPLYIPSPSQPLYIMLFTSAGLNVILPLIAATLGATVFLDHWVKQTFLLSFLFLVMVSLPLCNNKAF